MKQFILMADVIRSSEKEPENLMESFSGIVDGINEQYSGSLLSPLTITLGDEFQGVVTGLTEGIEIIFSLDEELLKVREPYYLRYVLHYGEIATPVNRSKAHGMLGEGLTKARASLEHMKKDGQEVQVSGLTEEMSERMNMTFFLYRSLYNDWHRKDRQTVFDFLRYQDYKKVASLHDRDNSSMWRKERSLKIKEFKTARKLLKLLADEY